MLPRSQRVSIAGFLHNNNNDLPLDAYAMTSADRDVALAAQALDGLRHTSRGGSGSTSSLLVQSSNVYANPAPPQPIEPADSHFIQRVSSIPLVSTSIRSLSSLYEHTKASSRMVQYSAGVLGSSVKPISKIAEKYVSYNVLKEVDEFACRQLDKLENRYPYLKTPASHLSDSLPEDQLNYPSIDEVSNGEYCTSSNSSNNYPQQRRPFSYDNDTSIHSSKQDCNCDCDCLSTNESDLSPVDWHTERRQRSLSSTSNITNNSTNKQSLSSISEHNHITHTPTTNISTTSSTNNNNTTIRYKSCWQNLTAGAVAVAGASAAVVSEESMKSLKYCLEWLQYAVAHIDHQIGLLRNFMSSLKPFMPKASNIVILPSNFPALAQIKHDIVNTLRRVIDVVGRYAGNFLTTDARNRVRTFILSLPTRWASLNAETPLLESSQAAEANEAHKIMSFAYESVVMLRSILGIFSNSVETAENWLGTLGRVPFVNAFVPHHQTQSHPEIPSVVEPVNNLIGGGGNQSTSSLSESLSSNISTSPTIARHFQDMRINSPVASPIFLNSRSHSFPQVQSISHRHSIPYTQDTISPPLPGTFNHVPPILPTPVLASFSGSMSVNSSIINYELTEYTHGRKRRNDEQEHMSHVHPSSRTHKTYDRSSSPLINDTDDDTTIITNTHLSTLHDVMTTTMVKDDSATSRDASPAALEGEGTMNGKTLNSNGIYQSNNVDADLAYFNRDAPVLLSMESITDSTITLKPTSNMSKESNQENGMGIEVSVDEDVIAVMI